MTGTAATALIGDYPQTGDICDVSGGESLQSGRRPQSWCQGQVDDLQVLRTTERPRGNMSNIEIPAASCCLLAICCFHLGWWLTFFYALVVMLLILFVFLVI